MSKQKKVKENQDVVEDSLSTGTTEVVKEKQSKISFSIWFDKQIAKGKVKSWQEKALRVFFKKKGLKDLEYSDTYDESFRNF